MNSDMKQRVFRYLATMVVVGLFACASVPDPDASKKTNDQDTMADADSETGADSDTSKGNQPGGGQQKDAGDPTDADTDTDSDGDTDSDSDTDTDADHDTDTDTDSATDNTTPVEMMTVSGIVKLAGGQAPGKAQGTLCLTVASRCPDSQAALGGRLPKGYKEASLTIENVSLQKQTLPATEIPFEIEFPKDLLAEDVYSVAAYIKTQGGECSPNGPRAGDTVTFVLSIADLFPNADVEVGCDDFAIENGQDVTGLVVQLNFINYVDIVPWLNMI